MFLLLKMHHTFNNSSQLLRTQCWYNYWQITLKNFAWMDKIQSTYRFIIERNFHIFISKDRSRVSTPFQSSQPSQPCQQFPRCIGLEAKTASLKKISTTPRRRKSWVWSGVLDGGNSSRWLGTAKAVCSRPWMGT